MIDLLVYCGMVITLGLAIVALLGLLWIIEHLAKATGLA